MIDHILVPLDGSELSECVLPHVMAIAPVTQARITFIHVLERPHQNGSAPIDPVGWHMQKQEAQAFLDRNMERMQKKGLQVELVIVEGNPADAVIDFARQNGVDLIILSSHGRTGLSGWNVSSVVQKILLRAYKSILLVRAYAAAPSDEIQYQRILIATDGSTRAEYVLPFAMNLAQFHNAGLILGTVIQRPQIMQRFPLSEEVVELINQLTEKNQKDAERYLDQLSTQMSLKGLSAEAHITAAENTIGAVYDMVEETHADLVMIAAHGQSGERRWPYGSIASSLIAYGSTPIMIMQDLSENDIAQTAAERALREGKGR